MSDYQDSSLPLGRVDRLQIPVLETIRKYQCLFMAPCLGEGPQSEQHQDEEDRGERLYGNNFTGHPIPISFVKGDEPNVGKGQGGRVYKARILNGHASFLQNAQYTDDLSQELALKVGTFRRDADRESAFLKRLARHPHEHITTFYTAFEYDTKLYFIAELAEMDLESFMGNHPDREDIGDLDRNWFLTQLKGLANALVTIHDLMVIHHHAIKPANILVFKDPPAGVKHRMKFTDFGSSGNGISEGTDVSAKSGNNWTTPTLPPEAHGRKLSSRPRDVWSLGCVVLDLLIWYHEGWEAVKKFRSETVSESSAWCYFDVKEGQNVLTGRVSTALRELAQNDGELVNVIRGMLEIDSGSRLKAADVDERLKTII